MLRSPNVWIEASIYPGIPLLAWLSPRGTRLSLDFYHLIACFHARLWQPLSRDRSPWSISSHWTVKNTLIRPLPWNNTVTQNAKELWNPTHYTLLVHVNEINLVFSHLKLSIRSLPDDDLLYLHRATTGQNDFPSFHISRTLEWIAFVHSSSGSTLLTMDDHVPQKSIPSLHHSSRAPQSIP